MVFDYVSLPKTLSANNQRGQPCSMPVMSQIGRREVSVLSRELNFALQTSTRLVLHSHASVLEVFFDQAALRA
jgi:hypothetical protein